MVVMGDPETEVGKSFDVEQWTLVVRPAPRSGRVFWILREDEPDGHVEFGYAEDSVAAGHRAMKILDTIQRARR